MKKKVKREGCKYNVIFNIGEEDQLNFKIDKDINDNLVLRFC